MSPVTLPNEAPPPPFGAAHLLPVHQVRDRFPACKDVLVHRHVGQSGLLPRTSCLLFRGSHRLFVSRWHQSLSVSMREDVGIEAARFCIRPLCRRANINTARQRSKEHQGGKVYHFPRCCTCARSGVRLGLSSFFGFTSACDGRCRSHSSVLPYSGLFKG